MVEGFEAVPPHFYYPLTLGAMSTGTTWDVLVTDDPLYVTEGAHGILWGQPVHGIATFHFAFPINAFAIDLKGVGKDHPIAIRASLTGGDLGGSWFDVFVDASGSPTDVRFFGLIDSAASFTSVSLLALPLIDPFPPPVGLDRVQYGIVPEPGAAGLVALGLALLGARRRRRRT